MNRYITIDENGYPIGDSRLKDIVIQSNMIEVELNFNIQNQKYNFESKKFELVEQLNIIDYEQIKKEAYQEYLETKEMFGIDSPEAQSAKKAYLDANDKSNVKSRHQLEQELSQAEIDKQNAIDEYTLELIEGGIL